MYNSEDGYTFEQNRNSQSLAPSSEPQHQIQQKMVKTNNSRPKNILSINQKANGILGTYARIIPKKPIQDVQRLYSQNIQLRQKIRSLQEQNVKIKTRVIMIQKQRQNLFAQFSHSDYSSSMLRDRRPSQKGLNKTQQKYSKPIMDENRRILHGYKDEISKLKLENARLKKTVKYTQIQQMQTQNQLLHEQMVRLKKYMQDVIDNTEYDQYQKQIENLNKQLQGQKQSKKSILMQMKKKDEEVEQVKNKMQIIATRKAQLQKKYNREVNSFKGQLHRVRQKQRELVQASKQKKQPVKSRKSFEDCKSCAANKQYVQTMKRKVNDLEVNISKKQKQITQLKKMLQQEQNKTKDSKIQKIKDNLNKNTKPQRDIERSPPKHSQKTQYKAQEEVAKPAQINDSENYEKHKKTQPKHSPAKNQQAQIQKLQSYSDDLYEDDQDNDEISKPKIELSSDKVDVFHVNLNDSKNSVNKNKNLNQQKQQDSFNNNSQISKHKKQLQQNESQEQVLFQKQEKPKNKQAKKKTKDKQPSVHRQKQKMSSAKAEKILKQTIKYRLIAQRYTYSDLCRDIKDSNTSSFLVEQLINIFSNEPFFLTQSHLQLILFGLFDKDELTEQDSISSNTFLKKMGGYIGQFKLLNESDEQILIQQIKTKLSKKKILNKLKQEAGDNSQISKKGFVQVLRQNGGLNDAQIQQCLAQVSVLSQDIAHINYNKFVQKISHS